MIRSAPASARRRAIAFPRPCAAPVTTALRPASEMSSVTDLLHGIHRVDGNKKGVFTRDRRPKAAAHELRRRWRKPA
ncbi:hypothetical protein Acy02nite_87470 [Actinoplanes cyaneus]|uniref:Uncharacterized protein n=1 Tax=Actinoplanes cyaneus TaxID=52696 RepID=A0A919MH34_9ACTN|nr:hypothetical protein Acy02nite_87470 [Actinoplanes cyaneus]